MPIGRQKRTFIAHEAPRLPSRIKYPRAHFPPRSDRLHWTSKPRYKARPFTGFGLVSPKGIIGIRHQSETFWLVVTGVRYPIIHGRLARTQTLTSLNANSAPPSLRHLVPLTESPRKWAELCSALGFLHATFHEPGGTYVRVESRKHHSFHALTLMSRLILQR